MNFHWRNDGSFAGKNVPQAFVFFMDMKYNISFVPGWRLDMLLWILLFLQKYRMSGSGRLFMHLFETEKGDKWVCITCGVEEESMITEKKWEWIFDKHDQTLRCSLCGHPDYDFED